MNLRSFVLLEKVVFCKEKFYISNDACVQGCILIVHCFYCLIRVKALLCSMVKFRPKNNILQIINEGEKTKNKYKSCHMPYFYNVLNMSFTLMKCHISTGYIRAAIQLHSYYI